MLASHALALVGVPMRRVIRVVQEQRDARYNLLRGYFRGADDDTINEIDEERLSTVTLPSDVKAVGQTLDALALSAANVRVVSMRRGNGRAVEALDSTLLESGDTLVLSGKPEALAIAEEKLSRGRASKTALSA